jgi:hypothetical protein
MSNGNIVNEEKGFVAFRRKVRSAEVLSTAMERLLLSLPFTGRVSVVVQNGRVLKSGYAEGYFRQRYDAQSGGCGSLADEAPKVSPIREPAPTGNVLPREQGTTAEASEGSIVE